MVCFFLWFDEISVFEAGKSLTEKVRQGREWLHGVHIFVAVECWKSNVKKCVDSEGRNGESESVLSGSHNGKSALILLVKM